MTCTTKIPPLARVLMTLAVPALVGGLSAGNASAQAPSPDCPSYEIEGTIEPVSDGDSAPQVAVYLHIGVEPVVGHQVFATFVDESGVEVGEAVVLTTGDDGRAVAPVPAGAVSVAFVADSPDQPECLAVSGSEPSVSLEIRSSSGESVDPQPDAGLAHTGPVTAGVVATAVLVAALGCGVWMGRGRKGVGRELAGDSGN